MKRSSSRSVEAVGYIGFAVYVCVYTPTLIGPFQEVLGPRELEYHYNGIAWAIVWDPNKEINIGSGHWHIELVGYTGLTKKC